MSQSSLLDDAVKWDFLTDGPVFSEDPLATPRQEGAGHLWIYRGSISLPLGTRTVRGCAPIAALDDAVEVTFGGEPYWLVWLTSLVSEDRVISEATGWYLLPRLVQ